MENPFKKLAELTKNNIEGEGFILRKGQSDGGGSLGLHPIEFRTGETTDKKIQREVTEKNLAEQKEKDRTKEFTQADHIKEYFDYVLEGIKSFSRTFKVQPNGGFDTDQYLDGSPNLLDIRTGTIENPAKLYGLVQEVQTKYPEFQFNFETDPEGRWLKYTVSKKES